MPEIEEKRRKSPRYRAHTATSAASTRFIRALLETLLVEPGSLDKGRVDVAALVDVVEVQDLRIPECRVSSRILIDVDKQNATHIMIFHVSTGKSASLKDQSNFSSATGSSVSSWYGARYGAASAASALIRSFGL